MVSWLKNSINSTFGDTCLAALVRAIELLGDRRTDLLRVLTYHRVSDRVAETGFYQGVLSATTRQFREQMGFLNEHYNVVGVEEVLESMRSDHRLPARSVLITFDDAYEDFAEHAWPVLQEFSAPATMFVATDFPSNPQQLFWWDRLSLTIENSGKSGIETPWGDFSLADSVSRRQATREILARLKSRPHDEAQSLLDEICVEICVDDGADKSNQVMDWQKLNELKQRGLTLGAHTCSHPLLNRVGVEEIKRQIAGSVRVLQEKTGSDLPIFAYPAGGFNDDVVTVARKEGIELAFTTCRGINQLSSANPLKLRRINIGGRTSISVLRAQLLGQAKICNRLFPLDASNE